MKSIYNLSMKIMVSAIFILVLVGCSSTKSSASQPTDVISETRISLELPNLPFLYRTLTVDSKG